MNGRTYSVIRSHRDSDGTWEKAEACGLDWEDAKREEQRLRLAEIKAYPEKTSWTRDIFYCQLEPSEKG